MEVVTNKFCIKCKHFTIDKKDNMCAAYATTILDLVTGKYNKTGLKGCTAMRINDCGKEAKLFIPK